MNHPNRLAKSIAQDIAFDVALGMQYWPLKAAENAGDMNLSPAKPAPNPATQDTQPIISTPAAAKTPNPIGSSPLSPSEKQKRLDAINDRVKICTKCALCESRNNTVFGQGNPDASLVFVGEAPGHDEDMQGLAFVGRAGKLLTDIIEKGMRLKRDDVFICNILKCRPPENRNPASEEVANCTPYLLEQLETISPKVICALGTYAAQTLLNSTVPIGRLRGKFHDYHGIPLMATYHPSYLLRSPREKKKTWDDVQMVMERMGIA